MMGDVILRDASSLMSAKYVGVTTLSASVELAQGGHRLCPHPLWGSAVVELYCAVKQNVVVHV